MLNTTNHLQHNNGIHNKNVLSDLSHFTNVAKYDNRLIPLVDYEVQQKTPDIILLEKIASNEGGICDVVKTRVAQDKTKRITKEEFDASFLLEKFNPANNDDVIKAIYIMTQNKKFSPFCQSIDIIKNSKYETKAEHLEFLKQNIQELKPKFINLFGDNNPSLLHTKQDGKIGLYFAIEKNNNNPIALVGFQPTLYKSADGKIEEKKLFGNDKILQIDRWAHIRKDYASIGIGNFLMIKYRKEVLLPGKNDFSQEDLKTNNLYYTSKTLIDNQRSLGFQAKIFQKALKEEITQDEKYVYAKGSVKKLLEYAERLERYDNCKKSISNCAEGVKRAFGCGRL